ncbi:hypothetical protein DS832_08745 [Bombilactobacillus bombi]|uniref:Thiamin/hydroxymethyl pyrimidine-binding YkoF putative domain-containing protein n=1 Tax=Bombilactobacillus bombi TaxID=1303590 RepID=A0A3R6UU83_9LACO|nr:YkoF family thiamine/hydroxymethylpyrimidine-binding protein [Bombilactobacillus bombi]RHW44897.1 hypothetical protein DS832_08745 [Bombilactobacillus bombi]
MSTIPKISCQISFYPLGDTGYNTTIKQVLDIIHNSDITAEVNDMATILRGEAPKIFNLLQQITTKMDTNNVHYVITTTISNTCGCEL